MILIYIRGLSWLLFVKILWCKQDQGFGQGTRDILSYDLMFSSFFRMDLALKPHLGNMSTEQILTKLGIVWRFTCVMQMSLGILFAECCSFHHKGGSAWVSATVGLLGWPFDPMDEWAWKVWGTQGICLQKVCRHKTSKITYLTIILEMLSCLWVQLHLLLMLCLVFSSVRKFIFRLYANLCTNLE